jgi:hypothetical protein
LTTIKEKGADHLTALNLQGFRVKTYKQAVQGLFTAGTSVTRRSYSEGGHLVQMAGFQRD